MRNDDYPTDGEFPAGAPVFNFEDYRSDVEGQFDNDKAADEFLRALWHIMCAFVDLGFDVKSSTENLPFIREIASQLLTPAPQSGDIEQQTDEPPSSETEEEDDS